MLALLGMEHIHAMNALKAWLTTVSNGVAMILFVFSHAVYWPETILMIVASMAGGYFGAYFAQKTKPEHVRMIVIRDRICFDCVLLCQADPGIEDATRDSSAKYPSSGNRRS